MAYKCMCDISKEFPWTTDENPKFDDKEIYTSMVLPSESSKVWRIPIYEPMSGYVYLGVKITIHTDNNDKPMNGILRKGATDLPVFGDEHDTLELQNGIWCPLTYPLTSAMIAMGGEDGLDLVIEHKKKCYGKVEFIAQRLHDIYENEIGVTYAFINDKTREIEQILTTRGTLVKVNAQWDGPYITGNVKAIPTMKRLLDKTKPQWKDSRSFVERLPIGNPVEDYIM